MIRPIILFALATAFGAHSALAQSTPPAGAPNQTVPSQTAPSQTAPAQSTPAPSAPAGGGKGAAPEGADAGLGEREMDTKALKNALKDIRYDPPFIAKIEDETGQFAEMVKLGYLIFNDTQTYAAEYTRNGLNCRNCHLQVGAMPNSAPLWGAFPNYPTYRSKNNLVNSFENRLQGCFLYSENGIAPPSGGAVLEALSAYAAWLSEGLPLGVSTKGRGYPEVKDFKDPDKARGEKLYADNCALCHGDQGEGMKARNQQSGYQFPPLWGPDSYNWGAGMHKESHFRNFIKANMPLGQPNSLTDQEAADIAAFVNQPAHTRPTRIHNPGQAPNF